MVVIQKELIKKVTLSLSMIREIFELEKKNMLLKYFRRFIYNLQNVF